MNYLAAVDDCFLDVPSGAARVAWDVACLVRDRGHQVTLLHGVEPSAGPGGLRRLEGMDVVGYVRPRSAWWNPNRAQAQAHSATAALRQAFGQKQWDVVHMHTPFAGNGALAALGQGPRYLYTMHSPTQMEMQIIWAGQGMPGRIKRLLGTGILRRLEHRLLTNATRVQTLSAYTRGLIGQIHGLESKVTVIPHWLRPDYHRTATRQEARRQLGWPQDCPILLTLRRHVTRMGLDVAVEAIAPLAAAGKCLFIVAGDGPLRPALQDQARRLGANSEQVVFPGRLSDAQLLLAYQGADLFVLPTRALECFGLITQEAMAFGCPVVASAVGAIPEMLQPILPELLVPPGQAMPLRQVIEAFLAGRLALPDAAHIERYVRDRYEQSVVSPNILRFIEGE